MTSQPSTNFAFLAHHDPRLVALGTQAEAHFAGDPVVAIIELRQFGEVLAKRAAAKVGLLVNPEDAQQQPIDRLGMSRELRVLFVVSAEAGERIRLISARKASPAQRKMYENGP